MKKEGNVLRYTGDIGKLPRCRKCKTGKGKNHDLLTYEHPYKMVKEKKKKKVKK